MQQTASNQRGTFFSQLTKGKVASSILLAALSLSGLLSAQAAVPPPAAPLADSVKTNQQTKVIAQIGQQQWQNISQTISKDIAARQMHIQSPQAGESHHHSQNARHGWQTDYYPSGKTTLKLSNGHYIDSQLLDWGYDGATRHQVTRPQKITSDKQQLDYHWSAALTERWTNTTEGTEQWFIVNSRPQTTTTAQPLSLTLALNSDLAISQQDNQSLSFSGDNRQISYNKLKVWDSRGQLLTAAMQLNKNRLTLSVDDRNAVYPITIDPVFSAQQAYIKASNTNADDRFGWSVALAADGNTLAVGAIYEASNATGVNGNQNNNSAGNAGAVYVFTRSGTSWSQQAYIKASNANAYDQFGISVALSADGNTLAVGAVWESSNATGVNGDQGNNDAGDAGAVYVFTRSGTSWSQQAYIKASNTNAYDEFGRSVALSADGNTLAVRAAGEDSDATGVNGDQANNGAANAGAVYVFTRSGTTWSQQAYIKASNTNAGDYFGVSVALSADGNTLAVGAIFEDSDATGVNGDQGNNDAGDAGAVYVFTRSGTTWSQQAYIKASNTNADDRFGGSAVALSADGNTLAVGAVREDSNATGVNGDQGNNDAGDAGALYVFTRSGTSWSQQAYIKASNTNANDEFGYSVALSADGNTLAVGAWVEDSNATGVNGDQDNNDAFAAGAVYVFTRSGTTWSQQDYIKASNTNAYDEFGVSVALSADGNTLAVGARLEDSNANGVNGDQGNNGAVDAGAVYVFRASSADLAVNKVLNTAAPYITGQTLNYSITVTNNGPDAASNVEISDTPSNLTITGVSGAGCAALPCTIATLANGASETITVTATINAAGAFDNAASVSADEADPDTSNNTDNTGNGGTAGNAADISINKVLNTAAPYITGQTLNYSITVTNNGPHAASNVVISDTPSNLSITGVSGAGCAALPCTIATLANGASETITVTATINAAGAFDNAASVGADEDDPDASNNTDNSGNGGTAGNAADVSINKVLNTAAPYITGQTLNYSITVTNNGPHAASNVVISDTPSNLTITGVSGAGCAALPCTIATLANAASETITVTATVDAAGVFTNSATVGADEADPDGSNNSSQTSHNAGASADVTISKSLNTAGPFVSGQTVEYAIAVSNNGPDAASNVVISDTPSNLTITGVSGAGCAALPCTIATLANGASETITVTATINAAGAFDNAASVSADEDDPDASNNSSQVSNSAGPGTDPNTPKNIPALSIWSLLMMITSLSVFAYRKLYQ